MIGSMEGDSMKILADRLTKVSPSKVKRSPGDFYMQTVGSIEIRRKSQRFRLFDLF